MDYLLYPSAFREWLVKTLVATLTIFCTLGLASQTAFLAAQESQQVSSREASKIALESPAEPTSLSGLVTETNKYSFKVIQDGKEYLIRVAANTAVGLKMNKPWFDWKNGQVVVDSLLISEAESRSATQPPRIVYKLPAKRLFLISKLRDKGHVKHFMASSPKRISNYLVTPENIGDHLPTSTQRYVSGSLVVDKNQQVSLQVQSKSMPVKLGFRSATMNGFSIAEFQAGKTQVSLAGLVNTDGSIAATSIVFEPVHLAQKTLTSSNASKAYTPKN